MYILAYLSIIIYKYHREYQIVHSGLLVYIYRQVPQRVKKVHSGILVYNYRQLPQRVQKMYILAYLSIIIDKYHKK